MKEMERKYKSYCKILLYLLLSLKSETQKSLQILEWYVQTKHYTYIYLKVFCIYKRYIRYKICFRKVPFSKSCFTLHDSHYIFYTSNLSFIRYRKNFHWHVHCMKFGHQIWRIPLTTTIFRVEYITLPTSCADIKWIKHDIYKFFSYHNIILTHHFRRVKLLRLRKKYK